MTSAADLDTLCINTIRTLCIDAVQKANSGHPGTPMAMAPVIYTLWQRFLSYNPEDPIWPNRDRFVLSAGHASTLLYSMLHLAGVKAVDTTYEVLGSLAVTIEDLSVFGSWIRAALAILSIDGPLGRNHDGAAWTGVRDECWNGDRQ